MTAHDGVNAGAVDRGAGDGCGAYVCYDLSCAEGRESGTRLRAMGHWSKHPVVRSDNQLSLGERAADRLRNGMGSWPFVFGALIFLAIWMLYNGMTTGFDPFPFILLNLVLSCLAALQGAILLIAAKRADQISSELAQHTYEIDQENLQLTREVAELTKRINELTVAIHDHIAKS